MSVVVELNVGGVLHTTSLDTLAKVDGSLLAEWFTGGEQNCQLLRDGQNRLFVDRDGQLFRFVLEYLRTGLPVYPESKYDRMRLATEAEFYRLPGLQSALTTAVTNGNCSCEDSAGLSQSRSGFITLGYQGTFSGRQGIGGADVNFRKINRILVSGRVNLCREAFGESLNEGRDPDRGQDDRYTSRFYLKHSSLETAFDTLAAAGYRLTASCATGTAVGLPSGTNASKSCAEEDRWAHYNQFVFYRSAN